MAKIHTYYDNLKVTRNADVAVIKAAYKALAQKYHPDRNPDNPEAERIMKLINKAYEVLSDPVRRAEHDRWIDEQERRAEQNSRHSSFNHTSQSHAANNTKGGKADTASGDTKASSATPNAQTTETNYFSVRGRMRRRTYAICYLLTMVVAVFIRQIIAASLSWTILDDLGSIVVGIIMTLPLVVPQYFLIKRLHDCNYSGWWSLIPLSSIVLLFLPPSKGVNRFGADPRDSNTKSGHAIYEEDYSLTCIVMIVIFIQIFVLFGDVSAIDYNTSTMDSSSTVPTMNSDEVEHGWDEATAEAAMMAEQTAAAGQAYSEAQVAADYAAAEAEYHAAVSEINAVWNDLHPSFRDHIRNEQRAINKQREKECINYANTNSDRVDVAKTLRYRCEVPQLQERTKYLRTQLSTVIQEPKPLPETGETNQPHLYGPADLQIRVGHEYHYLIKITDKNDYAVAQYFLRSGDVLNIGLPAGEYLVKYAYGRKWLGYDDLFGDDTMYAQVDEILDFYNYQSYELELIQQVNGNLRTSSIDKSQF